ncbi:hypothetical protein [Mesorhizobium sp. f-mel]
MNYQNIPFLFLGVPIRSTRLVTQISTLLFLTAAFTVSCRRICPIFALWRGSDNGGDALAAS